MTTHETEASNNSGLALRDQTSEDGDFLTPQEVARGWQIGEKNGVRLKVLSKERKEAFLQTEANQKEAIRLMKWAAISWILFVALTCCAVPIPPTIGRFVFIASILWVLHANIRMALCFRHNGRWH